MNVGTCLQESRGMVGKRHDFSDIFPKNQNPLIFICYSSLKILGILWVYPNIPWNLALKFTPDIWQVPRFRYLKWPLKIFYYINKTWFPIRFSPQKNNPIFFLPLMSGRCTILSTKTWFPIDFPPNKNHHPSSHVFLPCQELQAAGYEVQLHTFNARNLTAQSRKRVFFFGLREGVPGFAGFRRPWVPELQLRARDVLENEEELMLG